MEWIRLHPYASALALTGLVVILGTILVNDRAGTPTSTGVSAWSGNTAALSPTSPQPSVSIAHAVIGGTVAANYGTATLPYTDTTTVTDPEGTIPTASDSASYDFNALIAQLTQKTVPSAPSSTTSAAIQGALNAWSFIPTGLLAVASPAPSRTAVQQSLYDYGNEIGSYVEGYDATHHDQVQVLSDAQNDRQNPAKQKAVEQIGTDLETIGTGIGAESGVPSQAAADNAALSASYIDIGKKLVIVGQSEPLGDSALAASMEAYDKSVDAYVSDYVALANLFSVYSVTFASSDPGSVFSFSPSSL